MSRPTLRSVPWHVSESACWRAYGISEAGMASVQVDSSRTNRSLVAAAAGPSRLPQLKANPVPLVYRRMIEVAVADAKRIRYGQPTDLAILSRWWIQQFRPLKTDKDEWKRSFACACTLAWHPGCRWRAQAVAS